MAYDKTYVRLIHTSRWVKLRRSVLTEHPLCERCEADGFVTTATEVHHKIPVENGLSDAEKGSLMFNPKNLQPLCHRCHVEAHIEMGKCSKVANKERTKYKLEQFKKRFMQ